MEWKDVCFSEHSQLCARGSPPRRWCRLSCFGASHYRLRWRELVLGALLLRPPCSHRLSRVGQLSDGLEDFLPLGAQREACTSNLLARRLRSCASTSHGFPANDIGGSLLLVPKPKCCGRAKVPHCIKRNGCPSEESHPVR